MALVGDLKDLTLADIIQINCLGRNTARLLIHYPVGDAILYFQDGEIFDARLGDLSGAPAIYEALKFAEGAFRIDAGVAAPNRTVFKPWAELLMDGMRMIDEHNASMDGELPQESESGFKADFLERQQQHTQSLVSSMEQDLVGVIINDKYRIDAKIKDGELGTMYRATHIQMDVSVAIKVMHHYLVNDQAAVERFRRGAHAAARIHHPNAINVLDFGVTKDNVVYMAMEFLHGQTLRQRINAQKRISTTEVSKILRQVCAALEAAHRQDIIHRDLKPENIMLDDSHGEELIKVLDFGIAKLKAITNGVLTAHGLVMGTHDYMSPELCEGADIDRRSDIYSLGIILYESLTGQRPFNDPTPVGIALKHIGTKPDSMRKVCPDLPESVDAVVLRALEKRPEDRQQSAMMLAKEFEDALTAKSSISLPKTKPATRFEEIQPADQFSTRGMPEIRAGELGEARGGLQRPIDKLYDVNAAPKPATPPLPPKPTAPINSGPNSTQQYLQPNLTAQKLKPPVRPPTPPPTPPPAPPPAPAAVPPSPAVKPLTAPPTQPAVVKPTVSKTAVSVPAQAGLGERILRSNFIVFLLSALVAGLLLLGGLYIWQRLSTPEESVESGQSNANDVRSDMILIPGGSFKMGRDAGQGVPLIETPAHVVEIKPFYLDRFEVTNKQYREFVISEKFRPPTGWNGANYPPGADNLPVTNVSWRDAMAYCEWLSKRNGELYRLPTEEEWEYAARGPDGRNYPWGNNWNARNTVSGEFIGASVAVNSNELSNDRGPFGNIGLAGNVTEWTASSYSLYPGSRAKLSDDCENCRVFRGGNFKSNIRGAATTFRSWNEETYSDDRIGFRVAKDAAENQK